MCLAVNQASSIQNLGVTCESVTLGHNPFKLPLTSAAIFLPKLRKDFMSEYALELHYKRQSDGADKGAEGLTASALMGILSTLDLKAFEGVQAPRRTSLPEYIKKIEPLWGEGALFEERFVGAWMASETKYSGCSAAELMAKQAQLQELYEGRIASMQRYVPVVTASHKKWLYRQRTPPALW